MSKPEQAIERRNKHSPVVLPSVSTKSTLDFLNWYKILILYHKICPSVNGKLIIYLNNIFTFELIYWLHSIISYWKETLKECTFFVVQRGQCRVYESIFLESIFHPGRRALTRLFYYPKQDQCKHFQICTFKFTPYLKHLRFKFQILTF